jgi:hypothetical protein
MKTTVVNLNRDEYDVRIDRQTPWGNPFSHLKRSKARWRVATREESINKFEEWFVFSDDIQAQWMREHVHLLRGARLGCHCFPAACHGLVLAKYADNDPEQLQLI